MSNSTNRQLKVFLCHASSDKSKVQELYLRLINDGIDAWLDKEKLIPGQNWQIEIPKAVRNSDIVIVFLSSQSVNKEGFVQKEIKIALDTADEKPEGTIFIIPARLEDCGIPERISQFHWVDLFSDNGYRLLLKSLQLRANALGVSLEPNKTTKSEPERAEAKESKQFSQENRNPDNKIPKEKSDTKPSDKNKTRKKLIQKIEELEALRETLATPINRGTLLIAWGFLAFIIFAVIIYITATIFSVLGIDNATVLIIGTAVPSIILSFWAVRKIHLDREIQSKTALDKNDDEVQRLKKMLESLNQQEQGKA